MCGADDVQLGPVMASAGTSTTKVADDGQLEVTSWPRRGRDTGVRLRMSCAGGCEWLLTLRVHKEVTSVAWEPVRQGEPGTLPAGAELRG
jgi:hypothetical protein